MANERGVATRPINFLIYRPWKQIIGDCACATREKEGAGGERKTLARFINFTGTRQLFKLHRADRPPLSHFPPIYLPPVFSASRREIRRPILAMELEIFSKKKKNDSIVTIKFLGRDPRFRPFSQTGWRSVVRFAASRWRDHRRKELFRTTRNRERTGFLARYYIVRIERENLSFDSFLPAL